MPDSGLGQLTVGATNARQTRNGTGRQVLLDSPALRGTSRHGAEDLRRLAERFVFPLNHSLAQEKLTGDARTVLLAGRPGIGRRSAALMLLRSVGRAELPVIELPNPCGAAGTVDLRTIEPGSRLLLDLSHVGDSPSPDALGELAAFLPAVRQRDAWLAVVLPDGHQPWWHGLSRLVVELQRPRSRTVLRRHLAAEGLTTGSGAPSPEPSGTELFGWLYTASMREIGEFARLQASVRAPAERCSVAADEVCLRWSLLADARVRRQLAAAWRRTPTADPGWAARTRAWLQAAVTTPESEHLLAVLVEAADGRMDRLSRLHVVARDWAGAAEARSRVREALAVEIDAAQEIHPVDFELGLFPEGAS